MPISMDIIAVMYLSSCTEKHSRTDHDLPVPTVSYLSKAHMNIRFAPIDVADVVLQSTSLLNDSLDMHGLF